MKPSRAAVSVSLSALAVLLAGAALVLRPGAPRHGDASSVAPAPRGAPVRLAWTKGDAYVYRFSWENGTVVRAPAFSVSGSSAGAATDEVRGGATFEGELTLRCFGLRGDAYLFGARLGALAKHRVELFGKDALADDASARAALEGRDAFLEMDREGAVRAVYFAPETPAMFRYAMRAILPQLHVTVRDGAPAWSATEPGPSGRAEVGWARTSPSTLVRTRSHYEALSALAPSTLAPGVEHEDDLESRSTLTLAAGGFIQSLRDAEILGVDAKDRSPILRTRATFALDHLRTEAFDAKDADTGAMEAWHPGDREETGASAERQELTQLAAGMTVKGIGQQMFLVGIGQDVPSDFLLRAMALLRLHPELSDEVLGLARDRGMPARGRELAADVLAAVGDEGAQRALRALLDAPVVRGDGTQQRHLIQRLGLVAAPSPATVSAVRAAYASATAHADEDGRLAAAYTLGATAAHLARHGDEGGAGVIADGLARDLERTKSDGDRRGLIAAIGNAGVASTLPALRAAAADDDPSLRAEVAHALRKLEGDGARDLLYGMAADADGQVARNAIDALGQQPLGDVEVRRLAELVEHGGVPSGAVATVLTVLSKHLQPAAEVEAALRALAARMPGDTDVQGRVEALLAQIHAGAR